MRWHSLKKKHNRQYLYNEIYFKLTWWFRRHIRPTKRAIRDYIYQKQIKLRCIQNEGYVALLWSKERYSQDSKVWETWRNGYKPLWVYGWYWEYKLRRKK